MKVSASIVSTSTHEGGKDDPPRVEVVLALAQQVAQRRHGGRHAQAQEVQRGQRDDGAAHAERQEGDDRRHRVRQHMAPDDLAVAQAQCARRLDEFQAAVAQELGAHVVAQAHPAPQRQQHQQQQQRRLEDRREDDQQIQLRHGAPDLDEALQDQVDAPAEVALQRTGRDAHGRADQRQRKSKPDTDPKAIEQPRHHVLAEAVGAQPVQTAGWRRARLQLEGVAGARPVAVEREEGPIPGLGKLFGDERVRPVGGRAEIAAEGGFRVVLEQREVQLPVVARHQRTVVADQLGEGGQHQHHQETPQRHIADAVAPEARPGALVGRHRLHRGRHSGGRRWQHAQLICPPPRTARAGRPPRTAGPTPA